MNINNNDTTVTMTFIYGELKMIYNNIKDISRGTKSNKVVRSEMAYHLQQVCEKIIKIQIYRSGVVFNNRDVYTHDIANLINYSRAIGVNLIVPSSVEKSADKITDWEVLGRYDMHFSIRVKELHKWYNIMNSWYSDLCKAGYRN